jgi:hypothetical protein
MVKISSGGMLGGIIRRRRPIASIDITVTLTTRIKTSSSARRRRKDVYQKGISDKDGSVLLPRKTARQYRAKQRVGANNRVLCTRQASRIA